MSQREKTILGFLALIVLGAIVYYLFFNTQEESVEEMVDMAALEAAVTSVNTISEANVLNPSELQKLKLAEDQWVNDPFYKYSGERTSTIITDARDQFRYTGYVNLGGIVYAIITGWEYGVDDRLEDGDYFVVSIEADKVILGQRDDRNEIAGLLEVELEQDELNLFE